MTTRIEAARGVWREADPMRVSVAQFLSLAQAANVTFTVADGRLVMLAAKMNWRLWRTLRRCLDEIGVDAIASYLRDTSPEERAILASAA